MADLQVATVAGGCFWGVEDLFRKLPGVKSAVSGYSGGHTENPTYREICSGLTGHAEAVRIEFDPDIVDYRDILHLFWEIHDPTTLNRQGPDIGTQYRSAIFVHSDVQMAEAQKSREWAQKHFSRPIVTTIEPAGEFFPAEDYHQEYFARNGGHGCHIRRPIPKEG